jgi:hypothetical protein
MDGHREKYVELSLAGKWISLAREIILDNPGIEVPKFIEVAGPLMPRHIRIYGKKAGQVQLARRSLEHLIDVQKTVTMIDGRLTSKPKMPQFPGGFTGQILSFAATNGTVSRSDLPHIKHFSTLACQLCKRNLLKQVEKGVFAIMEKKRDAT